MKVDFTIQELRDNLEALKLLNKIRDAYASGLINNFINSGRLNDYPTLSKSECKRLYAAQKQLERKLLSYLLQEPQL